MALVRRAEQGDPTTLPALREVLKNPRNVDLLGGDLGRQVEVSLLNTFLGQNLALRETVLRKLELLRGELAGSAPTPLEELLVERVVACWLYLHLLETANAQKGPWVSGQGPNYERFIDRAQKQYLGAIKTLATVRKLAVSALQINVGAKQVNVAGPQGLSERRDVFHPDT
jgi:hypothetical protein